MVVACAPNRTRTAAPAGRAVALGLLGCGTALPRRRVGNAELIACRGLDTTDEWVREKTGIRERRIASAGEGVVSLATAAARDALRAARVDAADLEVVVLATCTSETVIPCAAACVQGEIGAASAAAWDVNSACSGFSFALESAVRYLAGGHGTGLVIGADCGSRTAAADDRLTSVFFGDGAGAAVVGAGESAGGGRLLASRLRTTGLRQPLSMPAGGAMRMDGRAVWRYAVEELPATVRGLCDDACVDVSRIDRVVAHQSNRNILAAAAESLGVPADRFACNIESLGNTIAASIPLAMADALQEGSVRRGDLVAVVGYGGGLSSGGHLWRL